MDALGISQSSLSSHLQICRQAGVLTTRKESRWIYYSLSNRYAPLIERIFSELQTVGDDGQLRRDARRLKKRVADARRRPMRRGIRSTETRTGVSRCRRLRQLYLSAWPRLSNEIERGMALRKCRKCGCTKEALDVASRTFQNAEEPEIRELLPTIEAHQTACSGKHI